MSEQKFSADDLYAMASDVRGITRYDLECALRQAAEDRKDAERYRCLLAEHQQYGRSWHVRKPCNEVAHEDLNYVIDAAMHPQTDAKG